MNARLLSVQIFAGAYQWLPVDMLVSLSSAHVVYPKYGVYVYENFSDIFNTADYPKSHPAWYLYVLLTAEVQRGELISVPKANLASDQRKWNSVVHFFCISSVPKQCKSQQPWEFPCFPGLLGTLRQFLGLWTVAAQRMPDNLLLPPQKPPSADSAMATTLNLPQLKNAFALKCFWELLMAALQLIYVKESWATDESGSNKMICKRPHSK